MQTDEPGQMNQANQGAISGPQAGHRQLADAGICLNVVVADIQGASARAMVKALIAGQPMHEMPECKGRLRASRRELCEALETEQFSAIHRFVANELMRHIEHIEQRITRIDQHLLEGLKACQPQLNLLQTIPGNNESAAKRKRGRIRKGNARVRGLLCGFAQAAAQTRCALGQYAAQARLPG